MLPAASGPPWPFGLIPVLFPVFWCLVAWSLARTGGWSALAQRCPAAGRKPAAGERSFYHLGGSISKGNFFPTRYNGTFILTAAPEGIYLKNFFLFRPFHPPLLLPWSGVRALEQRKRWFGSVSVLVFVDDGTTLEIFLPAAAREAVRAAAGARFAEIDRPPPLG